APWSASLMCFTAGVIIAGGVWCWDNVAKVDAPCGAISVPGVCRAWGLIALGLFADGTYGAGWNGVSGNVEGLFHGDAGQFAAQLVSVGVNFAWAFGATMGRFGPSKMFTSMRVSPEAEVLGLDVPEVG